MKTDIHVYVTGVILLNATRITHIENSHKHFRETVILSNIHKIKDEKCSFFAI